MPIFVCHFAKCQLLELRFMGSANMSRFQLDKFETMLVRARRPFGIETNGNFLQ